jgi:hypothetical protein
MQTIYSYKYTTGSGTSMAYMDNWCKDGAYIFAHTTVLDYDSWGRIFTQKAAVCGIPNNDEIGPTSKAGSEKKSMLSLWASSGCRYFPKDTTCGFIYGCGLHKLPEFNQNRKSTITENLHLVFWDLSEGPLFLTWNVHIHQAYTMDKLLNT